MQLKNVGQPTIWVWMRFNVIVSSFNQIWRQTCLNSCIDRCVSTHKTKKWNIQNGLGLRKEICLSGEKSRFWVLSPEHLFIIKVGILLRIKFCHFLENISKKHKKHFLGKIYRRFLIRSHVSLVLVIPNKEAVDNLRL